MTPAKSSARTRSSKKSREAIAQDLHRALTKVYRQLRSVDLPARMTYERISTLATIDQRGPIAVTELATAEGVKPSSMSRMISYLQADGLVSRRGHEKDRRGVLISCTEKGRRLYKRAAEQSVRHLGDALANLTGEQLKAIKSVTVALESVSSPEDRNH